MEFSGSYMWILKGKGDGWSKMEIICEVPSF